MPPTYRNRRATARAATPAARFICPRIRISAPSMHRDDAGGEDHVRRAEDLHVQAVGVVPPVVEGRGGDHGDSAPGGDERAQRSAEAPDLDGAIAQAATAIEGRGEDQIAARRCPPARRISESQCAQASRNVSRPMERCQEMSQCMPTIAQVTAATEHHTYQGAVSWFCSKTVSWVCCIVGVAIVPPRMAVVYTCRVSITASSVPVRALRL